MIELETLLKRFALGEKGEVVARENVVLNRSLLLRRLSALDNLCEQPEWAEVPYLQFHKQLLAYIAEGRKVVGYSAASKAS